MSNLNTLVEGFNAGYTIQKHHPHLADSISRAVKVHKDEFFQGLVAGSQQFIEERSQLKSINKLREASKDIPRPTRDRNIGDKDFELDR